MTPGGRGLALPAALLIGVSAARAQVVMEDGWPFIGPADFDSRTAAVGDLDGDGLQDLVIADRQQVGDMFIYAFRWDGTQLPGWPRPKKGGNTTFAALGDIDRDGRLEVAIGGRDRLLSVYEHDGSDAPGFPIPVDRIESIPVLADLDGDGFLDIAAHSRGNYIYVFDHTGAALPGWPVQPDTAGNGNESSSPLIADIDGDGAEELVVGAYSGKVYAYEADATAVSGFPVDLGIWILTSPTAADIDGDGVLEIVIATGDGRVFCFNGDGSQVPGWPRQAVGCQFGCDSVVPLDLDGDGMYEIIAADWTEGVHVWDDDGSYMSGFPVTGTNANMAPGLAVADVDADGEVEILLGTSGLSCYELDGGTTPGWPVTYGELALGGCGGPAVWDVDGDGRLEACVGGIRTFALWDTSAAACDPRLMPWPRGRQNARRNGIAPVAITPEGTLRAGWNLVSLPAEPDDPSIPAVLDDVICAGAAPAVYAYQPDTGYLLYPQDISFMHPGEGYWVFLQRPAAEWICGVTAAEAHIPLAAGWNLVGPPRTSPLPWADVHIRRGGSEMSVPDAAAAGWIEPTAYFYTQDGYRSVACDGSGDDDSLRPWLGYWVYAYTDGMEMVIP